MAIVRGRVASVSNRREIGMLGLFLWKDEGVGWRCKANISASSHSFLARKVAVGKFTLSGECNRDRKVHCCDCEAAGVAESRPSLHT